MSVKLAYGWRSALSPGLEWNWVEVWCRMGIRYVCWHFSISLTASLLSLRFVTQAAMMIASPAIQKTSRTRCSPSEYTTIAILKVRHYGSGQDLLGWRRKVFGEELRARVSWFLSLSLLSFVTYLCSDSDEATDIKTEELSFKNVCDLVRFPLSLLMRRSWLKDAGTTTMVQIRISRGREQGLHRANDTAGCFDYARYVNCRHRSSPIISRIAQIHPVSMG